MAVSTCDVLKPRAGWLDNHQLGVRAIQVFKDKTFTEDRVVEVDHISNSREEPVEDDNDDVWRPV